MTERRTKVYVWAVAFAAAAPFVPRLPFASPYSSRFVALCLVAVVWAWVVATERAPRSPVSRRLMVPSFVAVFAIVASALFAAEPLQALTYGSEGGLMGLPSWLALFIVFGAAARTRFSRDVREALRWLFVWAVPASLLVLWEVFSGGVVTGGFGNGNHAGTALVAVLPVALVWAREGSRSRHVLPALITLAAVMTGSTAVHLALAVEFLLVIRLEPALIGVPNGSLLRPWILRGGTVGVIMLLGAFLLAAFAPNYLPGGSAGAVADVLRTPTIETRAEMWTATWAVVSESPVVGVGPDGLRVASQQHLTTALLEQEAGAYTGYRVLIRDPHSLPLLLLASFGIAGALAFAWLGVAWLRASSAARGSSASQWRTVLVIGTAGYLTCMLFMPWSIVLGPLLPILAGLAVSPPSGGEFSSASSVRSSRAIRYVVASAVTVALLGLSATAVMGDSLLMRASAAGPGDEALELLGRATELQPGRPHLEYLRLQVMGYLVGEGAEDCEVYERALAAAPSAVLDNAAYSASLAQASLDAAELGRSCDRMLAFELVEEALERAPLHPDVAREAARVAIMRGRLDTARELLSTTAAYPGASERQLLYELRLAQADGDEAVEDTLYMQLLGASPRVRALLDVR